MSAWLLATREVHEAGGRMLVREMYAPLNEISRARRQGLLEPGVRGPHAHVAVLTPLGRAVCEGKVEAYVPYTPKVNGGRAPGTHRRWRATWLAALPEGVRLTPAVHRAQNDGTCYW